MSGNRGYGNGTLDWNGLIKLYVVIAQCKVQNFPRVIINILQVFHLLLYFQIFIAKCYLFHNMK